MTFVICVFIGIIAGVAGGLFGIGGGIIIVPALVLMLGFGQHMAQGTSLVAFLAPVAILGASNYFNKGQADLTKGAFIAAGIVAGSYFGSRIALDLDPVTMRRLFAGFLMAVAVYIFFRN